MAKPETQTQQMTQEEFNQIEREIQLGIRDTLPDGRKISDVQATLAEMQAAQEKERADAAKADGGGIGDGDSMTQTWENTQVEVTVHENGVMTARPVVVAAAAEPVLDDDGAPESDLPADFPGRDALVAAGIGLEQVAKLDKESLVGIENIGKATADKILSYGKGE